MLKIKQSMLEIKQSMFDIKQSMLEIKQSMFDIKQSMLDSMDSLTSRKNVGFGYFRWVLVILEYMFSRNLYLENTA